MIKKIAGKILSAFRIAKECPKCKTRIISFSDNEVKCPKCGFIIQLVEEEKLEGGSNS